MVPTAARRFDTRSRGVGPVLLAGVSVAALLTASLGHAEAAGLRNRSANPAAAAAAVSQASAQAAAAAASQAMTRVNTSLRAMRDAQAAARAAARAMAGGIPNGLAPGGLAVAPGATPGTTDFGGGLWQGANLPAQRALANGRTQVEIKQNDQKAILTWQSFNVGRETDLYFDQTAGGSNASNWIALNRVLDPGISPSRILGTIKAEGQVYIINKNGIIFGGSSQVNVNSLVASSLSLSNQQFMAGINKPLNPLATNDIAIPQFGHLGQPSPNGASIHDPSQVPGAVIGAAPGDVRIEAGAEIATASGGKTMLFAPHVINSGRISAPDGQVIMAAGEQVYIVNDASVRGVDVAVSAPMRWMFAYYQLQGALGRETIYDSFTHDLRDVILPEMEARAATVGYAVVNQGIVQADGGNITIMGREVVQTGALLAATALNNREGSIRLRAWDQGMACNSSSACELGSVRYWSTGTVTLGSGSVTAAMPDLTDTSEIELEAVGTRYKPGFVELRGELIDIQARANVVVPSGTISIAASAFNLSDLVPVRDGSRVYIGEDAYLSVAGLKDVLVPMERNFVEADLRINELRDSVLYRDSWLRGQKVVVDRRIRGAFTDGPMAGVEWGGAPGAWIGTPLADVSAWVGVGKTDLRELSTVGGSIAIRSSGAVITRQGSLLDVSGGSVRYSDGRGDTTKLLGADGRVYDISQASPDMVYVGIAGQFSRGHQRWGVTETWSSPLRAGRGFEPGYAEGRAAGAIQFHAAEAIVLEGGYWGGTVVGERQAATGKVATAGSLRIGGSSDEDKQWLIGNLIISDDPRRLPVDFTARAQLDTYWYAGGPQVPGGPEHPDAFKMRTTELDAKVLGEAGLGRIELFVSADVTLEKGTTLEPAPGSTFAVNANTIANYTQHFQIDGSIRAPGGTVRMFDAEAVSFGAQGVIDLSGQWVNEATGGRAVVPPVVKGGTAEFVNAEFLPGAVIDVSGGVWYQVRAGAPKLQVGEAGQITLASIEPEELSKVDLRGYSAGAGGGLTIETNGAVQIGGVAADAQTLRLSETLFADRGFRSVRITTTGEIIVPRGVSVAQVPISVDLRGFNFFTSPDASIHTAGRLGVLPLSNRAALKPASLSLTGNAVTIEPDAVVRTDIGGTIALATANGASGAIEVGGRLEAPAGTINLVGRTVAVTGTGALVATGLPLIDVDSRGLRFGTVLGGGTVRLEGTSVTMAKGALLDVSGASGEIDVLEGEGFRQRRMVSIPIASDGGAVTIAGPGMIEGEWRAHAGGLGARGGRATFTSSVLLSESATAGTGLIVRPANLRAGGFADLVFSSSLRLDSVDLTVGGSIAIAGGVGNVGGTRSRLSAPYIRLSGGAGGAGAPAGGLTLAASLIDVSQATIRGFAETELVASDIRLVAGALGESALLDVEGSLILTAGQVYPTGAATIHASEKIVVRQHGTAGLALSVGGALTLEAPVIEQGGTLRAPFGQIVLKATDRLTLAAGSVTSVSGDGLVLPYGMLGNNEHWTAGAGPVTALPEKRITLDAPSVDLAAGSVVDIRGGGDLYAWEHVPGPGGSHDVLAMAGVYAVVPAFNGAATTDAAIRAGDRVWLAGGNGLAPGWYTLLPARYALLPGAYAVQMVGGSSGASSSRAAVMGTAMGDGSVIMAGYRGNAHDGSHDQLRSSWRVMSGGVLRRYSEYNEAFANTFFASEAFKLTQYRQTGDVVVTPRLPMDGGSVVFKATADLILNGQLRSQAAAGGRGGLVDIAAEKIAILGAEQDGSALRASGYLVIDAVNLSGFGAGSLLVGGVRSGDPRGLNVDVTASDIVVRNGSSSAFVGAEIIVAASDRIEIGAGSVIAARGDAPTGAGDLIMAPQVPQTTDQNGTPNDTTDDIVVPSRDWGALIRVANGDVVRVRRENVDISVGGQVSIGAGAVLDGGKALLIDATRNADVTQARLSGDALSLASGRIGFGGGSGLVLDSAALAALNNTRHLTLRSYSTIDIHNAVNLTGLAAVTLDAAALVGYGVNDVTMTGNRLELENTASTFSEPVGAGHGRLTLVADELVFGEGAKALRGFDTVAMTGTTGITGEGKGSLDAGGASVTLSSAVITGRGGAGQSVKTTGALVVTGTGAAAPRDEQSLGARWTLTGRSVTFGGRIDALGGAVDLVATQGDVVVSNGAVIDVGGFGKQFFDVAEYTDAGRIALTATGGSVLLGAGAVLDLSAQPGGGGAGALAITSDGGGVALNGTIRAQAAAGERGASFALDIAALPDFAAFNQRLNEAGFSESRSFRIRSGSVTVDGTTTVRNFHLVADTGSVTIAGTIDARATYGGEIAIYAGNGLTVTGSAVLLAGATDTVDQLGSGRITLGVTGGTLAVQGGLIDVSGGEGGRVTLRAPLIEQAGADTVNVSFAGSITGAREIVLEGFKRFDLAELANNSNFVGVIINAGGQAELDLAATAAGKLNVLAEYGAGTLVEFVRDFDISAAYGNLGGLASQPNFHARPGMELNHSGDIVLKSNWNLGAGIVDEASALAAGVMAIDPILNKPYVVAARQGELLADHTTMVYRTGGSILGEPGTLTLRAGGDLVLEGSITDGFFQFGDKLHPDYLAKANSITKEYTLVLNGGFNNGEPADWWPLTSWSSYDSSFGWLPDFYLGLGLSTWETASQTQVLEQIPASALNAPYVAAGNAPAAKGMLPGGAGDPLKSAELFPTVTKASGETVAPKSWTYTLVAGAAPAAQSADPLQRMPGAAGSIILKDQTAFTYTANPENIIRSVKVDLDAWFFTGSPPDDWSGTIAGADWLNEILGRGYTGISADSTAVLSLGTPDVSAARAVLVPLLAAFVAEHGLIQDSTDPSVGYRVIDNSSYPGYNIIMPVATLQAFYAEKIIPNLSAIGALYSYPPLFPEPPAPVQRTVVPATAVRTGTGDITIAANRDVRLNATGGIYTGGQRDQRVLNDFTSAPAGAGYGVRGGHVRITAGGTIGAALPTDSSQMQHYTEWLRRQGTLDASYVFQPGQQSSWWVDYGNFYGGVGALGGGNVSISAGGDLDNLTVALPTIGRVRGGLSANERKLLDIQNGGAMTVEAGGTIKAGYYYIGRGAGSIAAAEFAVGREVNVTFRDVTTTYPIAPILSLGDATLTVRTSGDLRLQTVLDPLAVGTDGAYMSGHTERTALSLISTGGDVFLAGQAQYLSKDLYFPDWNTGPWDYASVNALAGNLYPSKTRITALNGSVTNAGPLWTLPSSHPELRILAGTNALPGEILMARAIPAMLPSPIEPLGRDGDPIQLPSWYSLWNVLTNAIEPISLTSHAARVYGLGNPARLPNEGDTEPSRVYALTGSIIGTVRGTALSPVVVANEQTWFRAGTDIRNIDMSLRNVRPTDVSLLEAGNDIIGATIRDPLQEAVRSGSVQIQGPGALVVSAGRDVYGTTLQLYSTGNRRYDANNRPVPLTEIFGLPSTGAAITVMAGLGRRQPSYDAFTAVYLDPAMVAAMPDYLKTTLTDGTMVPLYLIDAVETRRDGQVKKTRVGLVSFVEETTGEALTPLQAWDRFLTLPQLTRERFVRQVYMQELREAGTDQNEPGINGLPRNGGYNRGYAAIDALFPGKDWKGDVAVGNAMFRTMSGGSIEVLTPGGGLQVAALGTPAPAGYGLVTLGSGDINIFARDSVTVNRSRILTFAGGDEIIWSTLGDIDAGRGAKTTRVPTAPEVQTDVDAVTRVLERADISGSGIGTIIGFAGVTEGDVHLIAPRGTVNAGDAGVRVSGNLTIAAQFVLNLANIEVSGEVKGVPKQETRSAPLSVETKDKAAADAVRDVTHQATPSDRPSVIIVEILGYGGGADAPEGGDERRRRENQGRQSYNPNGAVQVVGHGDLTDQEKKLLEDDERRRL